jgi:hypothetical protein
MDQQILKTAVDDLHNRRLEILEQLNKTDEAIRALQSICEHKWLKTGHDSHKDHYECEYCGDKDAY